MLFVCSVSWFLLGYQYPVQVIDWKDSSPKWPVMCWWGWWTLLTHSLTHSLHPWNLFVSEMTYTVSSGTLNSTIPYLGTYLFLIPHYVNHLNCCHIQEALNMVIPAMQLAGKIPDVHVQLWASALLKGASHSTCAVSDRCCIWIKNTENTKKKYTLLQDVNIVYFLYNAFGIA